MANCMQAVIGIGSNMGDRLKNINGAVRSLSRLPKTKITACSHVYETKPMGYENQSMFYNAAVTVETELSAQLLRRIGDEEMPDFTGLEVAVIGGGNVAMDVTRGAIRRVALS